MHIYQTNALNLNHESLKTKYPPAFKNKIALQTKVASKVNKNKQKKVIVSSSNISNKNSVQHSPNRIIQLQTGQQRDQNCYFKSKDQKITKVKSTYQIKIPNSSSIKNIYTSNTKTSQRQDNSSYLSQTIKQLQKKIIRLEKEVQLKDKKINQLELVSKQFYKSNCNFNKQNNVNKEYINQNYQVDLKRLLRMLQSTQQYKSFATFGIDDRGIKFLQQVNKNIKTKIDLQKQRRPVHYCMCNKQYIAQSGLWVPQTIYSFGKQFIQDCQQTITKSEYQLLLYELNKLWRERQKRIINTLKQQKYSEIQNYKRKFNICSTQRQKTNYSSNKFKF